MTEGSRALLADYDRWLGVRIDLIEADLALQRQEMRAHEFRFLRGSFPLWLVRAAEEIPEVVTTDVVPAVGDLHVENFGTWRDREEVRRWGVNDLDELAQGPWALDLVRLAVSACLAPHIALDDDEICAVLWERYAAAVPRAALDLREPGADHLARLVPQFADAATFFAKLGEGALAQPPPDVVATAARTVAVEGWSPTWHRRIAGTGSLGHQRMVGVGPAADGTPHAREAKQLGPPSIEWAAGHGWPFSPHAPAPYEAVVGAVQGPGGSVRVAGWQIRELAPDVVRIELSGLDEHHSRRLLHSMAQAIRDVHGATGALPAPGIDQRTFTDAVRVMTRVAGVDFHGF